MCPKFKFINKKHVFSFLLILCFYSCGKREITVGIVGDQFGSYDADKSYQIMQSAVQKLRSHNPDILLHVGDITETIRDVNSFEDYRANFEKAITIMNGSGKPWLLAVGDHDVVPPKYQVCSSDRSREQWFMDCCQRYDTPVGEKPYYSTDVKGYHFISLYSLENLHTDPRWGSIFLNKINSDQLTWLRDDLEANKNSEGVIVLVHHPHWYVWSNWMEVHEILRDYFVIAVIAGHYHYDQDDGIIDGIHYIVMGSSGGVVKETDAHSGGAQEYAILNLKGRNIKALNLFEVESDSVLELTPRQSMDRIQALSCMLDNLWQDIRLVKNENKIVAQNSGSSVNNHIGLVSLANPIDIPIEITIKFPDTLIRNPIWNTTDSSLDGYGPVVLKAGERIGWANYSNVGQWYQPSAIWQAEIIPDINFSQITLSVMVKFEDTKHRFIRRELTYSVH